jgi:Spy/CpxP family protein refolding chaperone
MKRYLILAVTALVFTSACPLASFAAPATFQSSEQTQTPPPPDQVVAMMSSKLSLTDDQKTKITPIIADRQQKIQALKADTSMRKMKKAREAKSIMGDSDKKIEAILTDDQKQKYAAMKEQMKEKMKEKKNGGQ